MGLICPIFTYTYTSRENDGTGLLHYRFRYYSPEMQRFISEDPIRLAGGGLNYYSMTRNNPVNRIDPYGLWTFEVGASWNGQLGPVNVNWNLGFVIDGHGNLGWYNTAGGGIGAGADGSVGVSFGASTGDCIQDISGPFGNTSAGLGAGLHGSVEGFSGPGSQGQTVAGGGFTIGAGAGGGWSVGGSQTWVHPIGSLW